MRLHFYTALILLLGSISNARADEMSGSFVFMNGCTGNDCINTRVDNCYLTDAACATKAVDHLIQLGARKFLLPPQADNLPRIRTLSTAIQARRSATLPLEFFVYEGYRWENHKNDCTEYTNDINATLGPLTVEFPTSFVGVQLMDEPRKSDLASLQLQVACIRANPNPAIRSLKIFVNLLPLDSNLVKDPMLGRDKAEFLSPAEYGVDCAAGGITDTGKASNQVNKFTSYVIEAANMIQPANGSGPSYLATNIYPFIKAYNNCAAAREFVMSEGLSTLSAAANLRGITPISYTQNTRSLGADPFFYYANFHKLRWSASWFYSLGGKGISNFVSNSYDGKSTDDDVLQGMLGNNNDPTSLASDAQSTFGFTHAMETGLSGHAFTRFVAPFLSVNNGSIIGWLPANDVLVGEYGTNDDPETMLLFSRRYPDQYATIPSGQIGLNRWWSKVERLSYSTTTGTWSWQVVGQSTNTFSVDLSTFPGALYKLTR